LGGDACVGNTGKKIMNLRHFEVFHAVYLNGSVIGAAQTLNVSQPSVSKVLAHAETKLGFPLFWRLRGRLVPTDEAHILFREISELYGRMQSIQKTAKNLKGGVASFLRLAVLPALGLETAPQAVARLITEHSSCNVDIQTLHHDDVLRSLIERDSDLAIGYDAPHHPRLQSVEIGSGELVVLFRKDALRNPPPRINLCTLKGMNFITLANSGPVGNLYSSETVGLNLDLTEQISVRTFYVAAGLVRAGAGVAVIDEYTARASLTPELDFRPLHPRICFGVHAIYLADRPPSRLGSAFITAMSDILRQSRIGETKSGALVAWS
jgi:DNA-binding transcriptional LysR family regulator